MEAMPSGWFKAVSTCEDRSMISEIGIFKLLPFAEWCIYCIADLINESFSYIQLNCIHIQG